MLGIKQALLLLREKYINELLTWLIDGWNGITFDGMSREKAYVELAIIEAKQIDEAWSISDRDYHMKTKHFEKKSIKLENILSISDDFVIVRGIAGIGKTSMVDSYVLKWAKQEILNGKNNSHKIDFLFKLTCRKINTFSNASKAEEILRCEYEKVLKDVEFEDFEDISHRILILVDGADELKSLHEIREAKIRRLPGLVKSVCDLIDIRSKFLTGHKTMIAARPEACQIIDTEFKMAINKKMIEVCGFNSESVNIYVDNYFANDLITAQIVKQKIDESENLTVMASIPVYTWVICSIFKEDINIESPRTTTHLCSYACLLFIRNHIKEISGYSFSSNCSFQEIISNTGVLQVILCLGKLSKSTLKNKKVVFSEEDLKKFPIALESTGFIVKDQRSKIYQFRHLVLQEYFAALYMYLQSDFTKIFHENNYRSCIPIISGFSGIEIVDNEDPITLLIKKLKVQGRPFFKKKLKWLLPRFRYPAKTIVQNWLNSMFEKLLTNGNKLKLDENCSLLLAAFFECQGEISIELRERLIIHPVELTNIMFYHDIRNAMYLFTKLNVTNISKIDITNITKKKFPKNMVDLLKLYLDTKTNKLLHLKGGDVMRLYSNERDETITIELAYNDNNVDTHNEFLLSAISLVNTIELDYSLDNMYPFVRDLLKANKISTNVQYDINLSDVSTPNHLKMIYDSILMGQCGDKSNINIKLSCTRLTDEHIKRLQPCISYLEKLTLSVNESPSQFMKYIADYIMNEIETNNTCNLKLINLDNCHLTDEHIESLQPCIPYLQNLDISRNRKMSPQAMKCISDSIVNEIEINNTCNLKLINLRNCDPTDEHIESLQPCIPYLEDFDISCTWEMSPQAMKYISDSIINQIERNNTCNLKLINLDNCHLTDEHIESLQPCIPYLQNLVISNNFEMSPKATKCISDSIMNEIEINNTCNLKLINLRNCHISDQHIKRLQPCIPYLEDLDISGNLGMSSKAMKYISDSIMNEIEINNTCNLKLINLRNCDLTDEHIKHLQPCIPYLEDLDISGIWEMSSQAMKCISDSIMKEIETNNTCNLKLINLDNCHLTDEHIQSLQPCIPYLQNLDISRNWKMSSQAMKCISDSVIKAIEMNSTCNLKLINLRKCDLSDEYIKSLQPCIPYLEDLDISRNWKMSSQAMKCISDSIMNEIERNNTCNLKLINFHDCDLTDEHIGSLQPCIPYLENLDISCNLLSEKTKNLIDNSLSKELK